MLFFTWGTAYARSFQNIFISYFTPKNVKALIQYHDAHGLGSFILWNIASDSYYDTASSPSLLKTLYEESVKIPGYKPLVMGYWPNWSIYTDNRAQSIDPYPLSHNDHYNAQKKGAIDAAAKTGLTTAFVYAFLAGQEDSYSYWDNASKTLITIPENQLKVKDYGKLYFYDPWSDLSRSDQSICTQDKDLWEICMYAYMNRHNTSIFKDTIDSEQFPNYVNMGNFSTFAESEPPIKKIASIGGFSHNKTFELPLQDIEKSGPYSTHFIQSLVKIIGAYHLDGVDLDYENPLMTHQKSQQYVKLIHTLRKTLDKTYGKRTKLITLAILSDPDYIRGERKNNQGIAYFGFAPGTLKTIAKDVDAINLMTYDYHGSWDFSPSGNHRTGFLENIYIPSDTTKDIYLFSVEESVAALKSQNIDTKKIGIGIPAYGRSFIGVAPTNAGLYQSIDHYSAASIPPGDLDNKNCYGPAHYTCSGTFSYRFIRNHLLVDPTHLTETSWKNAKDHADVINGTTAYGNWESLSDFSGGN